MPGDRKHHTDKWRSCVEKVMAQGHDESSASAICTASLQEAGEAIFEAAEESTAEEHDMSDLRQLHLRGALGAVRTATLNGREHLVVPVVALMDGVIHAVNAATPERVTAATLAKAAQSWNGRPLVLGHPTKGGRQCSANEPGIHETHAFGTIFNSRMAGTKLLMDAYVDPERAERLGGAEFVQRLRDGEQCEVSVGAFVTTDSTPGTHPNGKAYKATWLETVGDHLAFLPKGRGACSLEMGCGAHRAAMHIVTAEGIEALGTSDGWTAEEGHNKETHGGKSDEGKAAEMASTPAEHRKAASYHAKRVKELQDRGVASKAHEDALEANLKAFETGSKADSVKANIMSDRAHEVESKARTTKARNAEEAPVTIKDRISTFLRSLMPRGWGDDEVKQELRDALLVVEPMSRNGEIVRVTNDKVIYCLYPPNYPSSVSVYDAPAPLPITYWSREYSFDTATQRFNVATERQQVEPTTVYAPIRTARAGYEDCETCHGTGQVKMDDKQMDCESCGGTGEMKKMKAARAASDDSVEAEVGLRAAERCEEGQMTKEERAAAIKALTECPCSGFTTADLKILEAADDSRIEHFKKLADQRKKKEEDEEKVKAAAAADLKAAQEKAKTVEDRLTAAEAALKAASERTYTEDEFLKIAPPSIRTLVEEKKAADAEAKKALVASLKAAGAFTEEELNAKSIPELTKLAALAKMPVADYSGRSFPAPRNAEDYTPPDPYEKGIKVLQTGAAN